MPVETNNTLLRPNCFVHLATLLTDNFWFQKERPVYFASLTYLMSLFLKHAMKYDAVFSGTDTLYSLQSGTICPQNWQVAHIIKEKVVKKDKFDRMEYFRNENSYINSLCLLF